jgi:hypothetical protein
MYTVVQASAQATALDALALAAAPEPHALGEQPLPLTSFLHTVKQRWAEQGLSSRPLTDRELSVLASKAGFEGLEPNQSPLPPGNLAAFNLWFAGHLDMIAAVTPAVYCYGPAQLVAGFDVGRAEAAQCLRLQGPGSFCLRLSSRPGHLVLSMVDENASGVESISHWLFSAERLRQGGLAQMLMAVRGAVRLIDTSTGRRHRPSVVRKAARQQLPAHPRIRRR